MTIEILLFDGFDDLDAFGPFEVLSEAGLPTRFVTIEPTERVRSAHGATIVPDGVLGDPDLVLVPGGGWNDRSGPGAYAEARRGIITKALADRHAAGRRIGSVCTGAMLLAEAGLLKGRPATTNRGAWAELEAFGADLKTNRVVDDGDLITAGGVTSGIDLALYVVERVCGAEVADGIAGALEYTRDRDVYVSTAVAAGN